MNLDNMISELRRERQRLDAAIAALEGVAVGAVSSQRGRRQAGAPTDSRHSQTRRRRMSAAARKRISQAQKARWAAWKKGKKAA